MNIDWKVLGAVVWNVVKTVGTVVIGFALFFSAMIYLPGPVLLGLFFLAAIAWWIAIEYKHKMFEKGKRR